MPDVLKISGRGMFDYIVSGLYIGNDENTNDYYVVRLCFDAIIDSVGSASIIYIVEFDKDLNNTLIEMTSKYDNPGTWQYGYKPEEKEVSFDINKRIFIPAHGDINNKSNFYKILELMVMKILFLTMIIKIFNVRNRVFYEV